MSPTVLPEIRSEPRLQGRHVVVAILGFFGVVFTVNGVMLYKALATHSGLVVKEPYRKGLAYNERIAADERQSALRWTAEITASRDGQVAFGVTNANGQSVSGLAVSGSLGRPSSDKEDVRLAFSESRPGHYVVDVAPIGPGNWQVDISVQQKAHRGEHSQTALYRVRRRLWLTP